MNNTMCAYCKQQLAPGDYDGVCAACDEASEQVGPYYEAQIEALKTTLQMALDHGEKKMYSWRHLRYELRTALGLPVEPLDT